MRAIEAASRRLATVSSETTIHEVARLMAVDGMHAVVAGEPAALRPPDPASEPSTVGSGAAAHRRCPRCGGDHLYPVSAAGMGNLLCLGCRRCWRPEHGHLVQVNPYACPGCPDRRFCLFLVDNAPAALQGALEQARREGFHRRHEDIAAEIDAKLASPLYAPEDHEVTGVVYVIDRVTFDAPVSGRR
jgi:hypothetical protein